MVSIWHPDPPCWFETFSTKPHSLKPPTIENDAAEGEIQAFQCGEINPEIVEVERISPLNLKSELLRLKETIQSKFEEMLTYIGTGDPLDKTSRDIESINTLQSVIELELTSFHDLLRSYRTRQASENIIRLLELEIHDYERSVVNLTSSQFSLRGAIELGAREEVK